MRKENYAPTIAHDLRALGDLYATVLRLMGRRLMQRLSQAPEPEYGPFEIVRPTGMSADDQADD